MTNRSTLHLVALPLCFMSCGLFVTAPKDPLAKVELTFTTYTTNTPTSTQTPGSGNAGTGKSNRPLEFNFSNGSDKITRIEMSRVTNGVTTVCNLVDNDNRIRYGYREWAGANTDYTFTVFTEASSKSFGPISITIEPAEILANGSANGGTPFGDQNNDSQVVSGPFFQSRAVGIGFGGYNGANYDSVLAEGNARQLDFALLTIGTQLTAVSPDLIKANATFPRLLNDCGFQTTTFAAYTGPFDPELMVPTLADVRALPNPPATATTIPLALNTKFVYRTSDGKKGLVRVDALTLMPKVTAGLVYSCEQ